METLKKNTEPLKEAADAYKKQFSITCFCFVSYKNSFINNPVHVYEINIAICSSGKVNRNCGSLFF